MEFHEGSKKMGIMEMVVIPVLGIVAILITGLFLLEMLFNVWDEDQD
jgi:hypothetical protein